jgi:ssRNA-specific RNase YbeY (16S rRNA maturation enzyme)
LTLIPNSIATNEGFLLHEALHLLGFDDRGSEGATERFYFWPFKQASAILNSHRSGART